MLASPDGMAGFFGNAVTGAGDVNGDGFADVVIAAPERGSPRAYIYFGGAGGLSSSPAATLIPPNTIGSNFGGSVANSGDVNGDGFADLVIGDGMLGSYGVAYLYLGSASGIGTAPSVTLVGLESGGAFGTAVATAGDVDGDGLGDLVIGASNVGNGVGRVYVYAGHAINGVSSSPSATLIGIDGTLSYFGNVVASAERTPRWQAAVWQRRYARVHPSRRSSGETGSMAHSRRMRGVRLAAPRCPTIVGPALAFVSSSTAAAR